MYSDFSIKGMLKNQKTRHFNILADIFHRIYSAQNDGMNRWSSLSDTSSALKTYVVKYRHLTLTVYNNIILFVFTFFQTVLI